MKITRQEKLADHLTELDENLLHSAYEIDDAEKLADYTKSKRTHAPKLPVFRRMAVLAACLMLTVATVFALPLAFSREEATTTPAVTTPAPEGDKIVLPPVRVGQKGKHQGILSSDYSTVDQLYAYSDAIAHIRVGNWLEESEYYTYFEAEVVELYHGTLPDHFILEQFASSGFTILGCPVFTYGNEYILFLKKDTDGPEDGCHYPDNNTYRSSGGHPSILELAADSEGKQYFVDRFHFIETSRLSFGNYYKDTSVATSISSALRKRDLVGQKLSKTYEKIYAVDDLVDYIDTLKQN